MPDATNLATAAWLLFTVTGSGNVSTAGFPTKALCEDGASLALTGHTVAENKAIQEQDDKDEAAWEAAHPPRPPRTDYEKEKAKTPGVSVADTSGECFSVTTEGLIRDNRPPCMWTSMSIGGVSDNTTKVARCFRNDDSK